MPVAKVSLEVLADKQGVGSWVDYVMSLQDIYGLGEEWVKEDWSERQ